MLGWFVAYTRLWHILKHSFKVLPFHHACQRALFLITYVTFTHVTLLLDYIFFPFFLLKKIEQPLFIMGMPRSGTTLLHKTLSELPSAISFNGWDIFVPAITAKCLLYPIKMLLRILNHGILLPKEAGHEVNLFKIEEEEFLLLHLFYTQIMFPVFLIDRHHFLANDLITIRNPKTEQQVMQWLDHVFRRKAWISGKSQIIAQMHMSVLRIESFTKHFSNPKFIFCIRSLQQALPSHLSLSYHVMTLKNPSVTDAQIRSIFDTRIIYDYLIYKKIDQLLQDPSFASHPHILLNYENITTNLDKVIHRVCHRLEIPYTETFLTKLEKLVNQQTQYNAPHHRTKPTLDYKIPEDQEIQTIEQTLREKARQMFSTESHPYFIH